MHKNNVLGKPEVVFHGFIAVAVFSGLQGGRGRVYGHAEFKDGAEVETGFVVRKGPDWFETKNTFYRSPDGEVIPVESNSFP